jgi:hypothetical protein
MDNKTSANLIQAYAIQHNLSILDALTELDHLCYDDWLNTLPDAPKGHVRRTTLQHDEAVTTFCRNRKLWIKDASALGLNLQGFTGV